MSTPTPENWITVQEATRRLGLSDEAIYQRMKRGTIRSNWIPRSALRLDPDDLEKRGRIGRPKKQTTHHTEEHMTTTATATRRHTFSGQGFDPFHPRTDDVILEDIAHHLAMTNRFGGACPQPYCVAEHAIRVARLVLVRTSDPMTAIVALHHDSAEAYLGDIIRPLKPTMFVEHPHLGIQGIEEVESRVLECILEALDLGPHLISVGAWEAVRMSDDDMLQIEKRELFGDGSDFQPMSWGAAKSMFVSLHQELLYQISKREAGNGQA